MSLLIDSLFGGPNRRKTDNSPEKAFNNKNFYIFAELTVKKTIMSETEMNSYRFGTGQEPTDEMLEQIMKEAAQEAREKRKKATEAHFEQMRRDIAANKKQLAERINSIING